MKSQKKILKNEKGQGVMEYIILTALVGIFCLAAVKKIGKTMDTRFDQINEKLQKNIVIGK